MTRVSLAATLAAALLASAPAHAGGPSRPIAGSATASGLAGAFTAVADDPYAIHANPAGLGFMGAQLLASLEYVVAPRSYEPIDPMTGERQPIQETTVSSPVPTVGITWKPSPDITIGAGAWNTYGGSLEWDKGPPETPAIEASTELVFELATGIGWAVNDRVSLGAGLRVGFGFFSTTTNRRPGTGTISGFGVGLGATAGLMVRASDQLTIGAAWRSPMDVKTTGNGRLATAGSPNLMDVDFEHVQQWPQSASLSAALAASDTLTVIGQLDWTQWSRVDSIVVDVRNRAVAQNFQVDWEDSIAVRLAAQLRASDGLVLRGGLVYDTNAVPDRTIERHYLDADKYGGAIGAGIRLSPRMVLDVNANAVFAPTRHVPVMNVEGWAGQSNTAPGDYASAFFTLSTGLTVGL